MGKKQFFCHNLGRVYCRQSCIACLFHKTFLFFFSRNAKPITSLIVVLHSRTASRLSPYSTITHNKQLSHARRDHIGFIFQRTMPQNIKTRGFLCTKTLFVCQTWPWCSELIVQGNVHFFQLLFLSIPPMWFSCRIFVFLFVCALLQVSWCHLHIMWLFTFWYAWFYISWSLHTVQA